MVGLFVDHLLGRGNPLELCPEPCLDVLPVTPRPDVLLVKLPSRSVDCCAALDGCPQGLWSIVLGVVLRLLFVLVLPPVFVLFNC